MSQASQLIEIVKHGLRQRGITYARLAYGLGMSESAVKRMFALRKLSLDRLEQICGLMGLEIADLLDLAQAAEGRVTELTEEQERVLVSDPKLLLVAIVAVSHWTAADILRTYRLSETELVGLLAQLDRLGIIRLLPENRIRVRLARNFTWRKEGPIQHYFEQRVEQEYFESSFAGPGALRLIVNGALSARSIGILQQRLRRITEEFDALVEEDGHLDARSRAGTTMVIAIRPWELRVFTELRRQKPA